MMRERKKQQRGKFLLTMRIFRKPVYLHEAGIANMGTPDEQPYLNWSQFQDEAQGFETIKTARAMAKRLSLYDPVHDYSGAVKVCRRNGR